MAEVKPDIHDAVADYSVNQSSEIDFVLNEGSKRFEQYESFRSNVRNVSAGKTSQFWLLYLDLMITQILIHDAIHNNNLVLLMTGWRVFIPIYFAMNKVNYGYVR